MTRAALLPAGADPFLNAYWLRAYREVWADEVDELRVMVCGQRDPEVIEYLLDLAHALPHTTVGFLPDRTDHGRVMRLLLEQTDADHVVFLEDDAFVRQPGVIDERFRRIESGQTDIVGTARGSASMNLIERAAQLWGDGPVTPTGETGLALFPCFVFGRRGDLAACSAFSATHWPAGTYLPPLDITTWDEEAADTFTYASWELRSRGLRIDSEAAYRSSHRGADAPWFHVGSLSAGYGNAFMANLTPESRAGIVADVSDPGQLGDWQKRMAWWIRVWEHWDGCLPEHHERYGRELQQFMEDVGAQPAQVQMIAHFFQPLITWTE